MSVDDVTAGGIIEGATPAHVREGEGYPLGENVTRLREERGLTIRALAGNAHMSPSGVSNIESGRITSPGVFTVYRLALALRVTMEELMGVSSLHSRSRINRR